MNSKETSRLLLEVIREMSDDSLLEIRVGNFPMKVELAVDPHEQQRGLMHRGHLHDNRGMLFCYERPTELSFWMRNTPIPLSIAFIGEDGVIKQVSDMSPFDERSITSNVPCRWALEANLDWFKRRGLGIGDKVFNLPR